MSEDGNVPDSTLIAEQIRFAKNTLHQNLGDIKSRCEAMLFRNIPSLEVAKSDWSIMDVKVWPCVRRSCLGGLMDLLTTDNERDYTPNVPGIHEHPAEQWRRSRFHK